MINALALDNASVDVQVLIVYDAKNGSILAGPTDYQHFFGVYGPPLNGLSDSYCKSSNCNPYLIH